MVRYLLYLLAILALAAVIIYLLPGKDYASDNTTLAEGKTLFVNHCSSCHGLRDDGIGPPLGGITNLLSKKRLLSFINNPSGAIESGDERAVAMHNRYKQLMPSFERIPGSAINSILAYINHESESSHIKAMATDSIPHQPELTAKLVAPVKRSGLKIELEDIIQLPQLNNTTDLGVVTLRAHPAGDGTLFASDQNGIIYRVKNGKPSVFLDMRLQIKDFQSGPGIATGIGSFDFHPDFLHNGLIYISHAETLKGQHPDYAVYFNDTLKSVVQWVIGEWKMNNVQDTVFNGTHRELLRLHAPTFAHGFQDMAFNQELKKNEPGYGLLYFGYGDGGVNNIHHPELCHNLKSFLGTIMRIDPLGKNSRNGMYGIPADNPFYKEKDPLIIKEIYAYGFRNPHRMAWDKNNGSRMMATDIGESNIEELNIIEKGGDYGWPIREGSYGINTVKDLKTVFKIPEVDPYKYKQPFAQYDHKDGNAISGGFVYEGDLAALKHKYIFGDIVTGKLFYVNIDRKLSDSAVYELAIIKEGKETNLREMSHTNRLHLRIAYDEFNKDLYIISKIDGKIRRVVKAY